MKYTTNWGFDEWKFDPAWKRHRIKKWWRTAVMWNNKICGTWDGPWDRKALAKQNKETDWRFR